MRRSDVEASHNGDRAGGWIAMRSPSMLPVEALQKLDESLRHGLAHQAGVIGAELFADVSLEPGIEPGIVRGHEPDGSAG
jgi:hypothetical protein